MSIPKEIAELFDALAAAAKASHLCLIQTKHKGADTPAYVICIASRQPNGDIDTFPVAELFSDHMKAVLRYETPKGGRVLNGKGETMQ
jgi:hypothetical protein